jgi:hypothetical protein
MTRAKLVPWKRKYMFKKDIISKMEILQSQLNLPDQEQVNSTTESSSRMVPWQRKYIQTPNGKGTVAKLSPLVLNPKSGKSRSLLDRSLSSECFLDHCGRLRQLLVEFTVSNRANQGVNDGGQLVE